METSLFFTLQLPCFGVQELPLTTPAAPRLRPARWVRMKRGQVGLSSVFLISSRKSAVGLLKILLNLWFMSVVKYELEIRGKKKHHGVF